MERKFTKIGNSPISISVYSVERTATIINKIGDLEIIFCIKGQVSVSYLYESFTLKAGEFISMDKDAYYLYDGKDNICVSFLIDLKQYESNYQNITDVLFICEGCSESNTNFPNMAHNSLKGMMLAILKDIKDEKGEKEITDKCNRIVDIFYEKFTIFTYHVNEHDITNEVINKLRLISSFMYRHKKDNINIKDIARQLNYTESYTSEYLRRYSVGFRNMYNYFRANASERLLLTTDMTILQISEECGFSDVKYYNKAFKHWYTLSPRKFREEYKRPITENIQYLPIDEIYPIVEVMIMNHYMEIFSGKNELK